MTECQHEYIEYWPDGDMDVCSHCGEAVTR